MAPRPSGGKSPRSFLRLSSKWQLSRNQLNQLLRPRYTCSSPHRRHHRRCSIQSLLHQSLMFQLTRHHITTPLPSTLRCPPILIRLRFTSRLLSPITITTMDITTMNITTMNIPYGRRKKTLNTHTLTHTHLLHLHRSYTTTSTQTSST